MPAPHGTGWNTATEHAASSSKPDPAASKEHVSLPVSSVSTPILTPTQHASASEDDVALNDAEFAKIVTLLTWITHHYQKQIKEDVIHATALEAVSKWNDLTKSGGNLGLRNSASIKEMSNIVGIMTTNKDGTTKDPNETLYFMRRVASVREQLLADRKEDPKTRDELNETDVSLCYQRFGRELLTHDLLPHQKGQKKYRLRNNFDGDTFLSNPQRSFVDSMIRKFMGDKRVASLIWQRGMPESIDVPLCKKLDKCMLQSSMVEFLQWYLGLANDIATHHTQENFHAQLAASSREAEQRTLQRRRREARRKAQLNMRFGRKLAKQRDDNKRSYTDMHKWEQKVLEDYDTGKSNKARRNLVTPQLKKFRCNSQLND